MKTMQTGGAAALSLLLAACGERQNAALENQSGDSRLVEPQTGEAYTATGTVTAIAGNQVTISHGPVEGLGWPAMTMTFRAGSPEMVQGVGVGDRVDFAFRQDGSVYTLTFLQKR